MSETFPYCQVSRIYLWRLTGVCVGRIIVQASHAHRLQGDHLGCELDFARAKTGRRHITYVSALLLACDGSLNNR